MASNITEITHKITPSRSAYTGAKRGANVFLKIITNANPAPTSMSGIYIGIKNIKGPVRTNVAPIAARSSKNKDLLIVPPSVITSPESIIDASGLCDEENTSDHKIGFAIYKKLTNNIPHKKYNKKQ